MKTTPFSDVVKPWLFAAPAMFIFLVVLVYPMVYSIYLSMFQWNGVSPTKLFVGLGNYVELFTDNRVFWIALKNNVIWVLLSVVVPTSLGLAFALILNMKFGGNSFFRGVFYFPAILSLSIVGLIWSWMYHPTLGLLNQILHQVGLSWLETYWLSNPKIALYAVFVAAAWHNIGLPMLLFLAGLQTIPKECLEAARIDGATRTQVLPFRDHSPPAGDEPHRARHHRDQFAQGLRHHLRHDLWRPREPDPGARHLDVFPDVQPQ